MREFETGATRSNEGNKPDYEGFLSPLVIRRYGQFMLKHQTQEDGKKRDSDNWQKGIPLASYIKSKFRHFVDTWLIHREYETISDDGDGVEDLLCADLFNTMGYLHTVLEEQRATKPAKNYVAVPGWVAEVETKAGPRDGCFNCKFNTYPNCVGDMEDECFATGGHPNWQPKPKEKE